MSTIVFDFGGVLLTDGSKTAWARLERKFGVPAEASALLWKTKLQRQADLGEISEETVWAQLQSLIPQISTGEIRATFLEGYLEIPLGVEALIAAKAAGWEVVLATNNVTAWLEYWQEQHGWMQRIDVVCCSSDLGVRKPSPEFFSILRERVSDPAAYFVDDDATNCSAAATAGFRPILVNAEGAWPVPDFAAEVHR